MSFCDNEFFAPESYTDVKGRRILLAWVFDGRNEPREGLRAGAARCAPPLAMTLGPYNRILMTPVEELANLRYNPRPLAGLKIAADSETAVDFRAVESNVYELDLELSICKASEAGVKVCCAADGSEETVIGYVGGAGRLKIDTTRSGANQKKRCVESAPIKLAAGEPLKLRVFVDRSMVEVFANTANGLHFGLSLLGRLPLYRLTVSRGRSVMFCQKRQSALIKSFIG